MLEFGDTSVDDRSSHFFLTQWNLGHAFMYSPQASDKN